ncbi:hypothetical protein P3W24_06070 [Luteibacter sp. PPL201]|jgi:hypothetical protein|uniref:DUF1488 family protein n=1 Tax=Luteibacter sahnii TaxID=3021977 RepID=A0ABT6B9F3_9GAMM|nr:hypothetical protein [Luteibacter sp. PPL193]MDY1549439.1 hypothetical protein [Luteibacter sp. PPL193]
MPDRDCYSIDIDAELMVGGRYEAHLVISRSDGEVIVRHRLNRRFDTYSEALMAAYERGRHTVDSMRDDRLEARIEVVPFSAPAAALA